jgi:DNA-binding CsgD family transcriptional regulator
MSQPFLPHFEPASDQPVSGRRTAPPRRKARLARSHPTPIGWETLSAREREVAEHILKGQTDAQIAEALCLSINTVRSHARRLLRKTGFERRSAFCARYAPAEVFTASSDPSLPPIPPYQWSRLTRTQKEVVSMALQGMSENATARRLEVGQPAVRTTMRRALAVLNLAGISQLRASYCPPQSIHTALPENAPLPGEAHMPLTLRQRHVISLCLQDRPIDDIAGHLGVTPKAIKMMLARLQERLELPSRQALLAFFASPPTD